MTKKRILITGSNGLLGQKLVELLTGQPDIDTIATASGKNRLPFTNGYQYHEMDITDPLQIDDVIGKTKPDVIIHTAAMTNVDQCEMEKENCWKLNVTAVEHLIASCKKYNVFLEHLSTDFIFDGTAGPYQEEDAPNPVSFYGWSKYAAEKLVTSSDIRWAIARTVLVYGIAHDMSRSNIILWVKKSLEEGKAIKVVTDQFRTPTLAEDLAEGCFLIAKQEAEGIFNISGKDFLTPYEMAVMTADYFGLEKSLITPTDASAFTQPAKRPPRTGFDLKKSRNVLGYEPHTFREGIALLAEQAITKTD
ncbi:SDR family oxidoreductase [Dyadobacter psychrotolerans]|uniref:dTDP-4-dehydrorhamnose reductase n=1 Tax=Dyadobacter psychrotolerans TaxID=2541721 RepID=A0A4R5DFR3_9BACT|nr:NAD(P)-dependent oxidoreductase [Dyadobacter psychrotolerans]TDE12766.1 NAD(P)-dependent oxidoreductase [Dyadobacter psychrotolerans]